MNLRLTKPVLWSGAAVGLVGYVTIWPKELRIPCAFNHFTDLQCPGCGTTRALSALVQGDVATAFNFNQLIFFAPLFLIVVYVSKNSRYQKQITSALIATAAMSALLFFLVRNQLI
jgi:hypothetical protein